MTTQLIGSIPKFPATEVEIRVTILCPQCSGKGCVCCRGDAVPSIPHIVGTVYAARRFGAAQYLACSDPECGAKFGSVYYLEDTAATGSITFADVPDDLGTITISDGAETVLFEIADGVGSGNGVLVPREVSAIAQATALVDAIGGTALAITASSVDEIVSLTHNVIGPVGNIAITHTANNMLADGMANGSYSETPPPLQHCRYCGATAVWTAFTPTEYAGESPAP